MHHAAGLGKAEGAPGAPGAGQGVHPEATSGTGPGAGSRPGRREANRVWPAAAHTGLRRGCRGPTSASPRARSVPRTTDGGRVGTGRGLRAQRLWAGEDEKRGGGVGLGTQKFVYQKPPPPPPAFLRAQVSAESANPRMDWEYASGCPWSTARATAPSPGRPTPGVVKQDKS